MQVYTVHFDISQKVELAAPNQSAAADAVHKTLGELLDAEITHGHTITQVEEVDTPIEDWNGPTHEDFGIADIP